MRKLVRTLLLLLASAGASRAEDVAIVAARLNDPAAECQYLLRLCQETHTTAKQWKQEVEQAEACQKTQALACPSPEERAQHRRRAVEQTTQALQDTVAVAKVIRAKHEKMPTCFEQCANVLNLEKLR